MDDQQEPYKAPQQTGRYYRDYFWYNLAILALINLRAIVIGAACFLGGLAWVYAAAFPDQFAITKPESRASFILGPITSLFGALLLMRIGWNLRLAWHHRSQRIQTHERF